MNQLSIIATGFVIAMSMANFAHANNTWTGFYAGVEEGFVFNKVELKSQQLGFTNPSEHYNTHSDFSMFTAGVQFGYSYQFLHDLVTSIEANISFNTNQEDILNYYSAINSDVYDRFSFRNQIQGGIKGRIGRALDWNKTPLLAYLSAGASFANIDLTYKNEGGDYYSKNTTQAGGLIGAGIEWAFMPHWSARAEYDYVDYGNAINLKIASVYQLQDPNGHGRVNLTSNNIVVAINYWI